MVRVASPNDIVLFGDFEVDLRSRELRRQGATVRLPDQSFQVLTMLLERRGELVTRREIRNRLWPADTFVDYDHGLNNAVNRLRESLGDTAETPRFIQTLPRRGYRFIGTIGETTRRPGAVIPAAGNDSQQGAKPVERRVRIAIASAAILILLGISGVRLLRRSEISTTRIHSLAVLPLENLSGDSSQDYFADGMTDALVTDLANISSLQVTSRTSAAHYKGSRLSLPEIARELKVDAVVQGSVVLSAKRVRVDVQLVQARLDRYLWAKAYDRDMTEVLEVQRDLAQNIVREIHAKLTSSEENRLASLPTVNPEAYDAYVKGRYNWNRRSLDGYNKGLEFFQQAVHADPRYAPAYVGIANCYNYLALGMGTIRPRDAARLAKAAAAKAIELDDNLADAHAALAFTLHQYDWNWAEAEQESRRARELNPGSGIHQQREQFHDLDYPLSPLSVRALAGAYVRAKQPEKAIDYYKKAIETAPDSFRMRMDLGGDYIASGRYQEAADQFQRVLALYGPNVYPLARLGYSYAVLGRKAEAERIVGQLKNERREGYVSYAIAEISEALGHKEEALKWLEKAYVERAWQMTSLRDNFPSLHADPRFQDLVNRMHFPPNSQR